MIKIKWVFILLGTVTLSSSAWALGDSFVGNGGSAGDLELLVAQKQLQKTFYDIQSADFENNLCTCEPVFEGRGECAPLEGLTEEERLFCSDQLQKMSGSAFRMLERKQILFRWTKEEIFVRQGQKTSTADAVANSANDMITLNQKRFLALTDTERIFLLAHEIFHLVPIKGKSEYLSDEGEIGPYVGQQGARRLLNAMAAGTVVEAYRNRAIQSFKSVLSRRKSYLKNWLDLAFVSSGETSDVDESVYAQDSFGGFGLSYTKYFGRIGLNLKYKRLRAERAVLTSINVEEQQNIFGLGLSYRFFPFRDPMTFLGQSFVSFHANAEFLEGRLNISDAFTGLEAKETSVGGSAEIKYHLPVQLCWFHIGAGLRKHEFEYSEVNLTNNKMQPYLSIGVSHAF